MPIEYATETDIPVESREEFVDFEREGKTVYLHKDYAESLKSGFRMQGNLTKLQGDFDTFKTNAETQQSDAATKAANDQKAAIEAKILELKGEGNHSEIHKLELQQRDDRIASMTEENDTMKTQFGELKTSMVEKENETLAISIASQYVPAELVESFSKLLIMGHIKNVEGKSVFTNASGEAVDNDIARIVEVLNKDPQLKHFAKFPGSKGGFGGKGGATETDGKVISRKDYEAKTPAEKATLMESGVQIID